MCDSSPSENNDPPKPHSLPTPKPKTPDWFIKQRQEEQEQNTVRDNHGNPVTNANGGGVVTSPPVSHEEHLERVHKEEEEVAAEEGLTVEEAEDEGRLNNSGNGVTDKRKSRLLIKRSNPSLAVGTKKYRTALNIPK